MLFFRGLSCIIPLPWKSRKTTDTIPSNRPMTEDFRLRNVFSCAPPAANPWNRRILKPSPAVPSAITVLRSMMNSRISFWSRLWSAGSASRTGCGREEECTTGICIVNCADFLDGEGGRREKSSEDFRSPGTAFFLLSPSVPAEGGFRHGCVFSFLPLRRGRSTSPGRDRGLS